jgi:restriction endonuclease S subunit
MIAYKNIPSVLSSNTYINLYKCKYKYYYNIPKCIYKYFLNINPYNQVYLNRLQRGVLQNLFSICNTKNIQATRPQIAM